MWDSLKTKLFEKLRNVFRTDDPWMSTTELEDYGRALGYSASNAGRRVRDLYADGVLEREPRQIEKHGKKLWVEYYRYKDQFSVKAEKMVQLGSEKTNETPQEKHPTEVHRQGGQDVTGLLPFNFPQRAVRALRQEVPSNAPLLPQKPVGDPPLRTP